MSEQDAPNETIASDDLPDRIFVSGQTWDADPVKPNMVEYVAAFEHHARVKALKAEVDRMRQVVNDVRRSARTTRNKANKKHQAVDELYAELSDVRAQRDAANATIDRMSTSLAEISEANHAANAVIEKLPAYEDTGERLVPGPDPCWMFDRQQVEDRGHDVAGFDFCGFWIYGNKITRFFSTREAAEAANASNTKP